jgi:MFS family permease
MFAELFPPRIRYTAASLPYAVGGIIGGGFAPAISEWLLESTGTSLSIAVYLMGFVAISIACLFLLRDSYFQGFPDHSFKGTAATRAGATPALTYKAASPGLKPLTLEPNPDGARIPDLKPAVSCAAGRSVNDYASVIHDDAGIIVDGASIRFFAGKPLAR